MRPPYDPNDWTALLDGPVFRDRTARLALADAVAARVQAYYGANLLFCALYGSLARQTDGPFSDVELFCALSAGPDSCRVYEWIEAGIKCKLRVYTEAALAEETARVDAEWPLSHNKIFHHRLLVGSPEPLGRLHSLACSAGDAAFSTAITQLYIAEVFELTAKLYNLDQHSDPEESGAGPVLIRLLEHVAIIVGMAERRCFSTRARMLNEAVSWGTLSGAFPELCACAFHGRWQDMEKIHRLLETLWNELRLFLLQRQLLLSAAIQPFLSKYGFENPGFIDLQINGYLGVDFSSANLRADMIPEAFDAIVAGGTVGFLPTIITTAPEVYQRNLPMLARAMEAGASGGHALGIHLEGPFLCPEPGYIGAHPPSCTRLPDPELLGHLQELAQGKIKAMTMAAGLPGDSETAAAAQELGIRVFLGHQRCTGEDLRRMARAGAVALTHLGNGLPNDLNRFGNPLWAGLLAADLTAMLIADGHHVCDDLIRIMVQVKGPDKLVLVSDAAPIAGLPPGRYFTLGNEVVLEPSGYLYAIGKNCLAGSSANILRCANYLASLDALSPGEIAAAATVLPLQLIGMALEEVPDAGGRMVFNAEDRRFDWVR